MRRSRFSEEQIIGILKEQEAGAKVAELSRRHGISETPFYKWKSKYGGLEVSDAKRLKALEDENGRLKKLLADACRQAGCRGPCADGAWDQGTAGVVRSSGWTGARYATSPGAVTMPSFVAGCASWPRCQSALNIDPLSACNFDPLFRHLMPAFSLPI